MIAALSNGFSAGTNDCMDITAMAPNTVMMTNFSFLVMGPSSFESFVTLSFSPGIIFFSGFRKIIRYNPDQKDHDPSDKKRILGEFEETDSFAGELLQTYLLLLRHGQNQGR